MTALGDYGACRAENVVHLQWAILTEHFLRRGYRRTTVIQYSRVLKDFQQWLDRAAPGTIIDTATVWHIYEYSLTVPDTYGSRMVLRSALRAYLGEVAGPGTRCDAVEVPCRPRSAAGRR